MKFSFSGGLFWIASQKSTLWRSPLFTTITASPSLLPGSDSTEMAGSLGRSSSAPSPRRAMHIRRLKGAFGTMPCTDQRFSSCRTSPS